MFLRCLFRNIVGYSYTESVKEVIYGLSRFNARHFLFLHKIKFYKPLYLYFILNLLWMCLDGSVDDCMKYVFLLLHSA